MLLKIPRSYFLGVDFTSRPRKKKPITCVWGSFNSEQKLLIDQIVWCESFAAFGEQLNLPGPWIGALDFPFGLPQEVVDHLGWPNQWNKLIQHYSELSRAQIRASFQAFCAARPAGNKFAHRRCDLWARSSPSMKWVNPPVAYMLHAGAPLLMQAGVSIPGMQAGDDRIALEGYPALLARDIIGKASYKADELSKQTAERAARRQAVLTALISGRHFLKIKVQLTGKNLQLCLEDGRGDVLDAVLCCVQAAWASTQHNYGLPEKINPVEGWIVSSKAPDTTF